MQRKKNILFILSDDQGAWAMGCAGNSELKTPNLDRLASEGTRLENFYCVSPVCSPARASILTGKIPSQHGVHDWLDKGSADHENLSDELKEAFKLDDPPKEYVWPKYQLNGDHGIRYLDRHKTFTEVLAENGYQCGISGKWHIGASDVPQAGFSYWKTLAMGGGDYYNQVALENGKFEIKKQVYITDYITDNAIRFLDEREKDKPFCLCVHYTAPHSPWGEGCHPEKFMSMYRGCKFESIPEEEPHPWCHGTDQTFAEWKSKPHPGVRFINAKYAPIKETWSEYRRESLTGYFAAVSAMDESIGKLIERIDSEGIAEDTLVVFTSDNGSNMGHHGIFGKGNGTYPVNMYQTSVKVPGIFRCPGTIASGKVSMSPRSHYDLYETLLDFAGVPFKKDESMPGESFCAHLCGKEADKTDKHIVIYDEYGRTRMILDGDWKLVKRYPDGPDELYDLKHDPDEKINRVSDSDCAEIVSRLSEKLTEWFLKYVDPALDGTKEDVRGKGQITSHEFLK